MKRRLPTGTLDTLHADPKNWRGYSIYVCKEDPRVIVPKRVKWAGWTVNFAHKTAAWSTLLGTILSFSVPAIFMAKKMMIGSALWFASLALIVVIICIASWFLSSPKRFEEAS